MIAAGPIFSAQSAQSKAFNKMSNTTLPAQVPGVSNRAIAAAIVTVEIPAESNQFTFSEALESLAQAIYETVSDGGTVPLRPIISALQLNAHHIDWAESTLRGAVEDGEALAAVRAEALLLSGGAVHAALGALMWERWRAEHPDDLCAAAVRWSIDTVARHIARRAEDLIGLPINAAEAAWAAVEGARRAELPLCRSAWRRALSGARDGVEQRQRQAALA